MEGLNPHVTRCIGAHSFLHSPGAGRALERKIRNLPQTLEMTSLGPKLGGGN